jgi:Holliday junction resolvase RusA-like endonuclease
VIERPVLGSFTDGFLVLPVPPSVNRAKGKARHWFRSQATQRFMAEVAAICQARRIRPIDGPVWVHWCWYRARLAGDLSNREKVLMDALNGFAWHDDEQIEEQHQFRAYDPQAPRIEICWGRAA